MLRYMCKAKIHHARVTETNLRYSGSITIDAALLEAVDILPNEKVHVLNVETGSRCETYVIEGPRNSGTICLNGASARWAHPGDTLIILTYAMVDDKELARGWKPKIAVLDEKNKIKELIG